MYNHNL